MSFRLRLDRSMSGSDKATALRKAGNRIQHDVSIGDDVEIIGNELTLGHNAIIENGTKLIFDTAIIDDYVRIGYDSDVRVTTLVLETGTTLGHHMRILVAEKLRIGRNAYIAHSSDIVCRVADIGEGFYGEHHLIIGGGGGATGPYSELNIGRYVHVGEFSVLNTARPLTIGDEAGLGAHVMLYTHGMWPPALEGYPVSFGPIAIGAKAWITGRCIVLPGVTVGDGTVVAMGSVVNKDLPARCLAGGVPAKVLREGFYNRELSLIEKDSIIRGILHRYVPELEFKGFAVEFEDAGNGVLIKANDAIIWYSSDRGAGITYDDVLNPESRRIVLTWDSKLTKVLVSNNLMTVFDLGTMEASGTVDDLSEDLRDFLRRNCVRFYTPNKFRSIPAPLFRHLMRE